MFKPRVPKGKSLNFRQKVVVVAMDVLLLAELTYSIYLGNQNIEYLSAIFLRTFLPCLIVTVVTARFLIKRFNHDGAVSAVEENVGCEAIGSGDTHGL